MSDSRKMRMPGGFSVDNVPPKSRYELSDGHPVWCAPTGRRGGVAQIDGGMVIRSDPAVRKAGLDVGYSSHKAQLRAPDVSVLPEGDEPEPGWSRGVPPLAIEYADTGQDENELQEKIEELLAAGTRFIWVVRLAGIRRVEVHQPGQDPGIRTQGQLLEAPGVLSRPVPVEALYDEDVARRVTLENLLAREGYESLDAVREEGQSEGQKEGRKEGRKEGLKEGRKEGRQQAREEALEHDRQRFLGLLQQRHGELPAGIAARVASASQADIDRWLPRLISMPTVEAIFGED